MCTINRKRFAGLNIHGFSPIKFFMGVLLQCLGQGAYYLTIGKYSRENFHGTLKNHESLAQQIFPCVWYMYAYVHTYICECTHHIICCQLIGNHRVVDGNCWLVGGNFWLIGGNYWLIGGNYWLVDGNCELVGGDCWPASRWKLMGERYCTIT